MNIRCESVGKIYRQGRSEEVVALSDCNFEIQEGKIAAILGISGAGKSTLLRLLGLREPTTTGRILLDGVDTSTRSERERARIRREEIGFVHQQYDLIPWLSVEENILLPCRIAGRPCEQEELHRLAILLQIERKLQEFPAVLSGGQQQRVAIARALIHRPRLLLCDEPTGNLDRSTRDEVIHLLTEIHRTYSTTMIIATHDRELAEIADLVYQIGGET